MRQANKPASSTLTLPNQHAIVMAAQTTPPNPDRWFVTDEDSNQWAQKVGTKKWKIFEDGEIRTFDVGAMSNDEIWEEVKDYYPSLEHVKGFDGWPLVVAECMSENRASPRKA